MFPSFAEWFGQQTEAVKLAFIAFIGAFFGGLWSVLKEWRKPVLATQQQLTSPGAPKNADDPMILMVAAIEAINVQLAQLLHATKENKPHDLTEAIEELNDQLASIEKELQFTRELLNRGKVGRA